VLYRYRLYTVDGDEAGEAEYAVYLKPGETIYGLDGRELRHWRDVAWTRYGFGEAGGPGAVLATIHHAYNLKTQK
jgi:hypothetical protein